MKHYDALGVRKNASQDEIKKAYRKLTSQHHPDREGGNPGRMAEINAAYDVLSNPERRKRYDETGDSGPSRAEKTLEEKAYAALIDVFAQVIMLDTDPIRDLQDSFKDAIRESKNKTASSERDIKKLEKRRGRVTVKQGDNIFTMLIDSKIASLKSVIAVCAEQAAIAGQALKMLEEYQYHPDENEIEKRTSQLESLILASMAQKARRGYY